METQENKLQTFSNDELGLMIARLGEVVNNISKEVMALKKDSGLKDNYIRLLEERQQGLGGESVRLLSTLFKVVKYAKNGDDGKLRIPVELFNLSEPIGDIDQIVDRETNEVVLSVKEG